MRDVRTFGSLSRGTNVAHDRAGEPQDPTLLVNASAEEYAPPRPLVDAQKEKQSLKRELHTVNVGERGCLLPHWRALCCCLLRLCACVVGTPALLLAFCAWTGARTYLLHS